MNLFRFCADMLHLLAIVFLLYRIKKERNCVGKQKLSFHLTVIGISCKTQEIYLVVFLVRYLDLFFYFISLYNTVMKLFFIGSTAGIIYLMRFKKPFCSTYDAIGDSFKHFMYLLPAAFVLTILCHAGDTTWEWAWSWTLWLEAIAFVPQIVMLN